MGKGQDGGWMVGSRVLGFKVSGRVGVMGPGMALSLSLLLLQPCWQTLDSMPKGVKQPEHLFLNAVLFSASEQYDQLRGVD